MSKFIKLTTALTGAALIERKDLVLSAMNFDPTNIKNEKYKLNMMYCKASIVVKRDSLTTPYPMEEKRKVLNTSVIHVRESAEEILKLLEE